jgi:hypothetical protein
VLSWLAVLADLILLCAEDIAEAEAAGKHSPAVKSTSSTSIGAAAASPSKADSKQSSKSKSRTLPSPARLSARSAAAEAAMLVCARPRVAVRAASTDLDRQNASSSSNSSLMAQLESMGIASTRLVVFWMLSRQLTRVALVWARPTSQRPQLTTKTRVPSVCPEQLASETSSRLTAYRAHSSRFGHADAKPMRRLLDENGRYGTTPIIEWHRAHKMTAGSVQTWKRRYFVLDVGMVTLSYFEDHTVRSRRRLHSSVSAHERARQMKVAKGMIPLTQIWGTVLSPEKQDGFYTLLVCMHMPQIVRGLTRTGSAGDDKGPDVSAAFRRHANVESVVWSTVVCSRRCRQEGCGCRGWQISRRDAHERVYSTDVVATVT